MKRLTNDQWNSMTLKQALLHIVKRNPGCCRGDILDEIREIIGDPDAPSSDFKLSTPLRQLGDAGYLKIRTSAEEYEHSGKKQATYTRTSKKYK